MEHGTTLQAIPKTGMKGYGCKRGEGMGGEGLAATDPKLLARGFLPSALRPRHLVRGRGNPTVTMVPTPRRREFLPICLGLFLAPLQVPDLCSENADLSFKQNTHTSARTHTRTHACTHTHTLPLKSNTMIFLGGGFRATLGCLEYSPLKQQMRHSASIGRARVLGWEHLRTCARACAPQLTLVPST